MNERIMSYLQKPGVALTAVGVIGAAVGSGVSHILMRRRYQGKVEFLERLAEKQRVLLDVHLGERLDRINDAVVAVEALREDGATVTTNLDHIQPDEEVEIVVERVVQPSVTQLLDLSNSVIATDATVEKDENGVSVYGTVTEEGRQIIDYLTEVPQPEPRSIFDGDDTWDWEYERNNRSGTAAYIIHADEYNADEFGFNENITLTWYAGDNILTDERHQIVPKPEEVVGELKFGHGSGDPNVCFIRNERLKAEYEVLRDPGSYQREVLGIDPGDEIAEEFERRDIRHARRPGKFIMGGFD